MQQPIGCSRALHQALAMGMAGLTRYWLVMAGLSCIYVRHCGHKTVIPTNMVGVIWDCLGKSLRWSCEDKSQYEGNS